jgi:hypothetical protein
MQTCVRKAFRDCGKRDVKGRIRDNCEHRQRVIRAGTRIDIGGDAGGGRGHVLGQGASQRFRAHASRSWGYCPRNRSPLNGLLSFRDCCSLNCRTRTCACSGARSVMPAMHPTAALRARSRSSRPQMRPTPHPRQRQSGPFRSGLGFGMDAPAIDFQRPSGCSTSMSSSGLRCRCGGFRLLPPPAAHHRAAEWSRAPRSAAPG